MTVRTFNFNTLPVGIEIKDLRVVTQTFPKLFEQPHKTTFYQIIWLTEGEATFRIDFQEIVIKLNEILIISVGQVCEFDVLAHYEGKLILFTESFFSITELDSSFLYTAEVLNPTNLNHPIAMCPEFMESIIFLLTKELDKKVDKFQPIISQSFIRSLLLEMERKMTRGKDLPLNSLGRRFYNAVDVHFREHKNTDFYVDLLVVSEKVLAKEIKKLIGKTPKIYIDSRVILEAKRLLSYSALSVKEIGYELGFDEPTNFNKYFRKHTGITPNQFRGLSQNN